jgi:elongation factor 3
MVSIATAHENQAVLSYAAEICITLNDCNNFKAEEWATNIVPYVLPLVANDQAKADAVAAAVLAEVVKNHKAIEIKMEVDDAGVLCNCQFSPAYGNKIVLNNTQLKMKRGYRYGLMGKNDSGKTLLMRAIANDKIDGFLPQLSCALSSSRRTPRASCRTSPFMFVDEILKGENIQG